MRERLRWCMTDRTAYYRKLVEERAPHGVWEGASGEWYTTSHMGGPDLPPDRIVQLLAPEPGCENPRCDRGVVGKRIEGEYVVDTCDRCHGTGDQHHELRALVEGERWA